MRARVYIMHTGAPASAAASNEAVAILDGSLSAIMTTADLQTDELCLRSTALFDVCVQERSRSRGTADDVPEAMSHHAITKP